MSDIIQNPPDLTKIESLLKDIATFLPTKGETTGGVVGGGGADGSIAARKVSKVVAQLLGRPIGGDPKSFLAALTAAFPEKDGQIVLAPVRAVVSLEVERGLLAASQGTVFHEVQLIVNDALKILEGLHSITFATDKEKAEAFKEIVRSEFTSLIQEAGRVDRPRKSRVDEIFAQLGTPDLNGRVPIESHLGLLRRELGLNATGDVLTNTSLVTSEEAQLIASMDLLDQYAGTLKDSFDRFFTFGAGADPRNSSFSGRLAFVSMLFSVVAASVRELEADMDAVELSEAERRTAFIVDPPADIFDNGVLRHQFLISIDGILSWIENFAIEEGPDLIAKSGLIGLNRVLGIVTGRLEPLVNELLQISQGNSTPDNHPPESPPHPGLTHSRVQNALEQLDVQLRQFNPHRAPSATFTFGSASTATFMQSSRRAVHFDASASSPGDGTITSCEWGFGDGSVQVKRGNPASTTIEHSYTAPGSFIVSLKVTNSFGLTAYASQTVPVVQQDIIVNEGG